MKNFRTTTLFAAGLMWVAIVLGYFCLHYSTLLGFFVFVLLNPSVMVANAFFAWKLKSDAAQKCLLAATIMYGIWIAFTFILQMMYKLDPLIVILLNQGGGFFSLTLLVPLWVTAFIMEAMMKASAQPQPETL